MIGVPAGVRVTDLDRFALTLPINLSDLEDLHSEILRMWPGCKAEVRLVYGGALATVWWDVYQNAPIRDRLVPLAP